MKKVVIILLSHYPVRYRDAESFLGLAHQRTGIYHVHVEKFREDK